MEPTEINASFQTPTSFTFVPEQLQILQDTLADVKKLDNKKDRHRMVKQVRKRVLDLPESKALDTSRREDLRAAIDSWFSARSKRQTNKIKFAKTWTARLVLYEEHKEEVNEIKATLYEKAMQKGDNPKRPFDYFQRAISKMWKQQSKTERKRLEKVAKTWNKEGVSREQKQEAATKKAWKYTKKFAEDMYKSLGLRFFFFVAMETPTGTVNTGIMDFNNALGGGASYTAKHSNWKTEGIDLDSWNEHNRDYYDPEKISAEISTTKVPRSLMHLDRNDFGEPILPNPLIVPSRQTGRIWRQGLVRAFLTYHYALASGSERAIPWKNLVPVLRNCIDEEYLPSDLLSLLGEPSTMKDDHCHSLLRFWYTRQTNGMTPTFRFDRYLVKDEWVDALPRERVEVEPTDIPPVPSGRKPGGKARGKGRRARRKAKSRTTPGENAISDEESERQSSTVTRRTKTPKSKKNNKGKEKSRDTDSGTSSNSASSSSDSGSTSSRTNMTGDTDSDLDEMASDPVGMQSRGRMEGIGISHQGRTLPHSSRNSSIAMPAKPPVEPSHTDVEYFEQPDVDAGDEDMSPSQDLNLAPELRVIAKMLEEGIRHPERSAKLLQAFGELTVKSQSQSPLKQVARSASAVTDLGKRRGRSSTEGLPPASPTKKTRVQSFHNLVEGSPGSSTANLPESLTGAPLFTETGSATTATVMSSSSQKTVLETDETASASTMTTARGGQAPTTFLGKGRKANRNQQRTAAGSPRVTRSNSPKKRTTRAHPT